MQTESMLLPVRWSFSGRRPGGRGERDGVDDRNRPLAPSARSFQEGAAPMTVRVPRASLTTKSGKSVFVTRSPEETEALGRRIARGLTVPGVVLLRGSLGTGKTTLARGIATGLGLED